MESFKFSESLDEAVSSGESSTNQASPLVHSHTHKLWGYVLTAFSQVFLLLFLPYLFAETSADHFFGIWAYTLADFFINRLLGLTAFFIPTGFFLVGCYYLFEKREIGEVIRKIFITACWFFTLSILLLGLVNMEDSRLAGLFPRFFHALFEHGVQAFFSTQTPPASPDFTGLVLILFEGLLFTLLTFALARTFAFPTQAAYTMSVAFVYATATKGIKILKSLVLYVIPYKGIAYIFEGLKATLVAQRSLMSKLRVRQGHTLSEELNAGEFNVEARKEVDSGTSESTLDPTLVAKPINTLSLEELRLATLDGFKQSGTSKSFLAEQLVNATNIQTQATLQHETSEGSSASNYHAFLDLTASTLFQTSLTTPAQTGRSFISQEAMQQALVSSEMPPAEAAGATQSFKPVQNVVFSESVDLSHSPSAPTDGIKNESIARKLGSEADYFGVRIINHDGGLFKARLEALANSKVLTPPAHHQDHQGQSNKPSRKQNYQRQHVNKLVDSETDEVGALLVKTFQDFGIAVHVVHAASGPVITCYELKVESGVRLSRIMNLSDNLALALAAPSIRIVAPIPGKAVIGIEIPNRLRQMVTLSEIIESTSFRESSARLPIVLGSSILGAPMISDLTTMPHLLVAGATGSGKSVLINAVISSLMLSLSPNDVRFLMVDPKMVELNVYNGIPHLLAPVISDPKAAALSLKWLIYEMEARYRLLEHHGVRSLHSYHQLLRGATSTFKKQEKINPRDFVKGTLPYIVVIIDEFADLMMTARRDVEDSISRLAAMSRAVGIHLILATQRPSVDVITGVIKANFPSRVAFQVSSKIDSRTIIDGSGAEKLLGKGDMLFQSTSALTSSRIQGAFLSDEEVSRLIETLQTGTNTYIRDAVEDIFAYGERTERDPIVNGAGEFSDQLFASALEIARNDGKISASYLQRKLKIGYNRAARIVEAMEEKGFISSADGTKPREVLFS